MQSLLSRSSIQTRLSVFASKNFGCIENECSPVWDDLTTWYLQFAVVAECNDRDSLFDCWRLNLATESVVGDVELIREFAPTFAPRERLVFSVLVESSWRSYPASALAAESRIRVSTQ